MLAAGFCGLLQAVCWGQAAVSGGPQVEPSRVDVYAGYGYLHPVDSDIGNFPYRPMQPGVVGNVTGYFSPYVGVEAEGSVFPKSSGFCLDTAQAGLVGRYQIGRLAPFAHALGGGARVGGPVNQPCAWGWGATGGVGLDYVLPGLENRLALRPIQADFHYSQVDYGPLAPGGMSGGLGEIHAYRLSGGLVARFGAIGEPRPVMYGCAAQPSSVYPGDPVMVNGSALNLKASGKYVYQWTSTGGKVSGADAGATVATAGMGPGDYAVSGRVLREKGAKVVGSCTALFTVKAFEPPVISCTAVPGSVALGGQATITAFGQSPQNRTLTYSYEATGGQVAANGAAAVLTASGATPGAVTVTCTVVDDLGKTATATTVVNVTAPKVAAAPHARPLCPVSFERDRRRPNRVDNEAKGCLDDIGLTLNRESGAHVLIVGKHAGGEMDADAAERAMNVREYLVREKGVDATRIEMRIGDASGRTVENTLIPAGAAYDPGPVTNFDPATIQRHGPAYGVAGAARAPVKPRARRRRVRAAASAAEPVRE